MRIPCAGAYLHPEAVKRGGSKAASAPLRTEKQFQANVVKAARTLGWLCYHTHDSRRSEKGFPDLTMVRRDRLLFAELKVGKNKLTPDQQDWLGSLLRAGQEAFVWRPEDWAEIVETLS